MIAIGRVAFAYSSQALALGVLNIWRTVVANISLVLLILVVDLVLDHC